MKIQDIIPNIEYDNSQYKFNNIFFKYNLKTPIEEKYLQVYSISDGESLEDISYQMYGDPVYFWTIIIINDMSDPLFDIPLPEDTLQEIARDMSTDGTGQLDFVEYSSQYDTLTASNDEKRNIKVIKSDYLNQFLTEMIKESVNI